MNFKALSANSLMLYFKQEISQKILDQVQATYLELRKLDGIVNLTPSYCSILIEFDIFRDDHQSLIEKIKKCLTRVATSSKKEAKLITIPTCYNTQFDLERIAKENNLTIDEVIQLHTKRTYRVYAIGFLVGFAYLAKVESKIATPRLATPRAKVPKGSVAIADNQTAIYPKDSAGGWNIIGHTEFDAFSKFEIGDRVKFERI